jgi:nucleoside-diphosphate-sugar epimerase
MTHIQNLTEVVLKCIDRHTAGIHVFNVADQPIYDLKTIFGEILLRKTGRKTFVFVPGKLVALVALLGSCLGANRKLSKQSLKYLTEDSVLSVKKAENLLDYTGQYEFYSSVDQLDI